METEQISYLSYLSGSVLFSVLTLLLFQLWRKQSAHISLVIAAFVSALWHLLIAANYSLLSLGLSDLIVIEIYRYGAWITALLGALKFTIGQALPRKFLQTIHACWITALLFVLVMKFSGQTLIESSHFLIWSNLLLSILGLVTVEQLFKNAGQYRLIKLYSLIIGGMFAYDVYLFSYSLIFNEIDPSLWQARGIINGCAALLMTFGALTITSPNLEVSQLSISRPVVFYTTSMTASGSLLALMAIGGYYVQLYGGSWGEIIYILLLFLALLSIATLFISNSIRSRLNVWINMHFFQHKYDYRVEWLKLIHSLSHPSNAQDFHHRAVVSIASIFKSPHGGLWLKKNHKFIAATTMNLDLSYPTPSERIDSPFCQTLKEHEWIFSPRSPESQMRKKLNGRLPLWIKNIPSLWLVLPLLTDDELLGFVILTEPKLDPSLTWEDIDLLKTVGRQVASYLDRHRAAELLAESRQFDAFNKLTAFIMHDLKNLIAQQALVVENAAKYKDNPAFVEDAINTIDNSVSRMNTLLKKLQQDEPSGLRSLKLDQILTDTLSKCQTLKPSPSLHREGGDICINADPDRLLMSLLHVIKNAQEATNSQGFIDVTLRRENNNAIITIEDNGTGMSEDFIQNQLFKPFATTKSGKGMGIGVYQAREYIESIGGTVSVESAVSVGTTFTISIPSTKDISNISYE